MNMAGTQTLNQDTMQPQEDVFSEAFNRLRPVCVLLTKQTDCNNARALLYILQQLDGYVLQHLQQYVLFPLRIILHNPRNKTEDLLEVTLQCLLEILEKTSLNTWQLFSDYFQLFCSLLSTNIQSPSASFPEEIQLVTVRCLHQLIQNANSSTLSSLFNFEYLPSVGHAVSVLINVAEHQKLHVLRVQALSCLSSLCQDNTGIDPALVCQIGCVFTSFLPGASSALVKIIINEPKVAKYALHTWGCMLVKVLDDTGVSEAFKSSECRNLMTHKFVITRNESWLKQTGQKLHILLTKASVVARYGNWKVRLEVANFVNRLLETCKRSLSESIPILVEMLVSLSADPYPQVANASTEMLSSVRKTFHENNCRDITEILEENLFALTMSLPRIIMVADDEEKLKVHEQRLYILYVLLSGEKISQVLCSSSHLKRLSICLMTVLEFDTEDIKIVQQKNLYHDTPVNFSSQDEMQWNPERRFKRFNDNRIEEVTRKICRTLAAYGDLDVLVEYFLDLFLESCVYQRQAVWVLNELIAGCCYPHPIAQTCIKRLINEYLSSPSWHSLPDITEEAVSISLPLTTKNNTIVLSCLLLEGLAIFAKVLKEDFELFLISTLYPVLVKVSDSNMLISQSAFKTVKEFFEACKYSCIEELIYRNVDYLLDCLTHELRHAHFNTNALLVLQAMFQYGGANLLPLIQQTINQVLDLIGQNQQGELKHLLLVCEALVEAIKKWFVISEEHTVTSEPVSESVCDFIVKHHRLQQENIQNCDGEATREIEETTDTEEVIEDSTPEKPALHVKIVVQVLENCVHLLGIESLQQQTLILSIVMEGVICISSYQDDMLPLAHQLWSPIVQRLSHSNYNVRIKAVECVASLANACHDFLKKRVLKDVLPNLIRYLKQQSQCSLKKDCLYHHTLEYKLQLAILSNIGHICVKVDIDGLDVLKLAFVCIPYLDDNQPPILKTCTQKLMKQLKMVEYDAIELMLEDLNSKNSVAVS
ncbi:TELO2-interacting protein 1 homolog [Anneissia japonica]|uniref:TELO2-interacting protein 1 homolog n=1 Tax=Anneissia japonica TaxID=1529436 RepID=UPI001425727D|nr:TELO2-interacting protein 1 homolog [Anneissia japonica]